MDLSQLIIALCFPAAWKNNLYFHFFQNVTSIFRSPTIWRMSEALSSKSSTFTHISYTPESSLSDARINRMLSLSVLRMFTLLVSRGCPFFVQETTGLGLPWRKKKPDKLVLRSYAVLHLQWRTVIFGLLWRGWSDWSCLQHERHISAWGNEAGEPWDDLEKMKNNEWNIISISRH